VQSILQQIQAGSPPGQTVSARLLPTQAEPTEVTPIDDEDEVERVVEAETETAAAG